MTVVSNEFFKIIIVNLYNLSCDAWFLLLRDKVAALYESSLSVDAVVFRV